MDWNKEKRWCDHGDTESNCSRNKWLNTASCGFDPECHYKDSAASIAPRSGPSSNSKIATTNCGADIEPLVRGLEPPRLLVYCPVEYEAAKGPLVELLALGAVMRPERLVRRIHA